jgi:hypothetical protein
MRGIKRYLVVIEKVFRAACPLMLLLFAVDVAAIYWLK